MEVIQGPPPQAPADRIQFRILDQNNQQTSIYVYVVLTLAVAFTILALILAILAWVKADNSPVIGPTGITGDTGSASTYSDFEVPGVVYNGNMLVLTAGNLSNQFLIFEPSQPKTQVKVVLPVASTMSGVIWRFYNKSAEQGVLLETQAQDTILNGINNPIPINYVGFTISDGLTEWSTNL